MKTTTTMQWSLFGILATLVQLLLTHSDGLEQIHVGKLHVACPNKMSASSLCQAWNVLNRPRNDHSVYFMGLN